MSVQKNRKFKPVIFLLFGFFVGAIFVLGASVAYGQLNSSVTSGFNYAQGTGLGTTDLRTVAFTIVNVILGFLSIVAILLILYGGFVWMTSQGNRDQVDKEKKIITNAAIGLVIIFLSFSIAQFVFGVLMRATGVGGGNQCNPVGLMEDVNVDLDGCLWKHQCLLVGGAQVWGPVFKDNPFC